MMEDNFRHSLIIISAVVIGAIFVHGLWTIRKNKNPYKLKASKVKVEPFERNFDRGGFDQDGVSKVKVKLETDDFKSNDVTASKSPNIETPQATPVSENDKPSIESQTKDVNDLLETSSIDMSEKSIEEISVSEPLNFSATENQELIDDLEISGQNIVLEEVISEKPIYAQPVSRPKLKSKSELKRDQIELNFGAGAKAKIKTESIELPSISATKEKPTEQDNVELSAVQPEVLALSVVMPNNQIMQGAALLPMLLTLGLKYGEMNIFHRHQDNAGTGPVTFSLANMMNPGSFDLDNMETYATQGVTLFMMLPNAGNAFDVYQQMLSAAKQISEEFTAQILDDKRNVMTKQTEQHYESRIRSFEIKNRAMAV
jgi:cell division protein ZipA|tara:strand:- start:6 stop:1121 length:1116 start_codon:yes stop_codon:yes gene_type:complete